MVCVIGGGAPLCDCVHWWGGSSLGLGLGLGRLVVVVVVGGCATQRTGKFVWECMRSRCAGMGERRVLCNAAGVELWW